MQPLLTRSAIALAAASGAAILALAPAGGGRAATPKVTLSGGSAAQQALMRRILAGMSPSLITRVKLGPPPRNLGDWPRAPTYLDVTAGGGSKDAAEWQTWLFKGAFGDLSVKLHLPPMFRFSPMSAPPAATAAGAAALEAGVRQAVSATAADSGVQIVSLQILRPDGLADALVLQVANPASYMKNQLPGLLQQLRGGGRPELDGSYVALEDSTGAIVWSFFQSARMGSGGDYARPDLAGCNPIMNLGGPFGYSPPACPA